MVEAPSPLPGSSYERSIWIKNERTEIKSAFCWAAFFARWLLGLLFFMAGWYKVFEMGALEHARQLFVEGYQDFWMPAWLLWGTGFVIPFLELGAGALLIIGFRVRECLIIFGFILITVLYGHLLKEPFYDISTHIFVRATLLFLLFFIPTDEDRWSLDSVLSRHTKLKA